MIFRFIVVLAATVMFSGCASIVSGHNQSLSVVANGNNANVVGAKCSLTNDKGQWFTTTPGSVTVRRSYGNLAVSCENAEFAGVAQVKSTTKAMALGNIIFGGVIGVGVDVASGAAYDYPDLIAIQMLSAGAQSKALDLTATALLTPIAPAAPSPAPLQPTVAPAAPVPIISVAMLPAAVPPTVQPASKAVAPKGGQDSFSAERLARAESCQAQPTAVLVAKGPGFETYTVACAGGDALAVRCEFGNCRVLR